MTAEISWKILTKLRYKKLGKEQLYVVHDLFNKFSTPIFFKIKPAYICWNGLEKKMFCDRRFFSWEKRTENDDFLSFSHFCWCALSNLYSPEVRKWYFLCIHKEICSKVPIFYFNGPKRPSDNCYAIFLLQEITVLLLQSLSLN